MREMACWWECDRPQAGLERKGSQVGATGRGGADTVIQRGWRGRKWKIVVKEMDYSVQHHEMEKLTEMTESREWPWGRALKWRGSKVIWRGAQGTLENIPFSWFPSPDVFLPFHLLTKPSIYSGSGWSQEVSYRMTGKENNQKKDGTVGAQRRMTLEGRPVKLNPRTPSSQTPCLWASQLLSLSCLICGMGMIIPVSPTVLLLISQFNES